MTKSAPLDNNSFYDWPRKKVEAAIAEISAVMKGPMSNLERECHHRDRKELRERLAQLDAKASS